MSSPTSMQYVRLGQSGLKVSKIILGCMTYGSPEWLKWVLGKEEGIAHINAAYDAGINAFDTANVYSNGLSEIILGEAIKKHNLPRDKIVVLTKVYGVVGNEPSSQLFGDPKSDSVGYVNQHGLSRKHIFDSVKHSLERLQLDYIDVLQCHRFDYDTPISETMKALHDVVQAGYVRYIGMSSCYAYQFHAMQNYAIQNNLTPFISMQNHYNLIYREEEREMFPTLKIFGVGSIPWSPLGRGKLARPFAKEGDTKRGETDPAMSRYKGNEAAEAIITRVEELAKKKGLTMAQLSIAWILSKEGVTAPIVGTTSIDNLKELIGEILSLDEDGKVMNGFLSEATKVELTPEDVKFLEEEYRPVVISGHS
ncbi:NADP-dependent oxidoreductase domain-containing protein [Desarmillaria tabescens]|uniref:NADP-dependent oxidoreductase domain-containing protein n=1 Tax=Armillaria tabescens TaxID=1929756 RepID=A0AA39KC14_ARMTA|nr:NADP-dependent oxidoreductase domain-containing protein [Desarmillaria tabescens]KAK0457200.1 NADP-dependent oxidoreductase domain-containing protein [Desarmillaria tabescens]